MVALANSYTFFNTGGYRQLQPQRQPAESLLISRVPQYISDPLLRARVWISFAPNLPPSEAQMAYQAISSAVAAIPDGYTRRNLLWEGINEALSHKDIEQATQLANVLEGDYRQSALALVELARL
jgi:hypothetical protein